MIVPDARPYATLTDLRHIDRINTLLREVADLAEKITQGNELIVVMTLWDANNPGSTVRGRLAGNTHMASCVRARAFGE